MRGLIVVVGAGPAGFYAADQLLAAGFEVDMTDRLPTPFGLVRAGVAPDHPKIKSVTRVYEKTAAHPAFRYFGGVELGHHVSRRELVERYGAVVYAFGAAGDNRLGIPGEDLSGSHPSTDFVGWYNGHPDFADLRFDLAHERAIVVGNGNVALDVARMLVLSPDELALTDTADYAIEALCRAGVREVVLLGRRGPAQAAFTNPELRELGELSRADVVVDPAEVVLDPLSAAWLASDSGEATARRNVETLRKFAGLASAGRTHRVALRFLRSPLEILGDEHDHVRAVRVVRNRIEAGADGRLRAVATGEQEVFECGLVIRAVGYRGQAIADIPFDERRGVIPNDGGRVLDADGSPRPGEYAVGWIKRGPTGVIGTNKKDAADTVARIIEDADQGRLSPPAAGAARTGDWLHTRAHGIVTWRGWRAIDEHECRAGRPAGRPRVKLLRIAEMCEVAARGQGSPVGTSGGAVPERRETA